MLQPTYAGLNINIGTTYIINYTLIFTCVVIVLLISHHRVTDTRIWFIRV